MLKRKFGVKLHSALVLLNLTLMVSFQTVILGFFCYKAPECSKEPGVDFTKIILT